MRKMILVVLFISPVFSLGEKVIVLKELVRPYFMQIVENELFISEEYEVFIYSLNDFKLKKRFGRKGEGPGEFRTHRYKPIAFDVQPENIFVESLVRISVFDRKGQLKKDLKLPFFNACGLDIKVLGNNRFVGYQYADEETPKNKRIKNHFFGSGRKTFNALSIYNSKFKKIKEVCREEEPIGEFRFPLVRGVESVVYNNDIFVLYWQPPLCMDQFDKRGQLKYSIKIDNIERKKVNPDDIEGIRTWAKLRFKEDYERIFKNKMKFTKYWPAVKTFFIDREVIYILSLVTKNGKRLWYLYDLKGNLIKKKYLPFVDKDDYLGMLPTTVNNYRLYQVVENEENEEWELHVNGFKRSAN